LGAQRDAEAGRTASGGRRGAKAKGGPAEIEPSTVKDVRRVTATGEQMVRKPRHSARGKAAPAAATVADSGMSPVGGNFGGTPEARIGAGLKGEGRTQTDQQRKAHEHKVAARTDSDDTTYRAGFACFVGRPNAGKSTLTNAIIGQKIAITSSKPQTTRHVIRGILHKEHAQLVLVDTPGLHRPRTLLGERLNDLVREVWSEVDVIGICFPADEPVGRGDRFISAEMAELKATVIAVVTKVDLVDQARLAKHLLAVSKLYDFAEIVPVSAVSGHQVEALVDVMIGYMPESPQLYPDDVLTEEPEQVLIGELIREAALEGVRDELPHSIAVLVDEMVVEGSTTKIYANLYVERDSQKSIVIGTGGARLKDVGTKARAQIEALLGHRIYLDLHVRVAKEWQRDPKQLRKLGF
jgi:GTP-binding protein Era